MMESFLAEYGLSTAEGVGLMCLAEALLRVPDAETIDELIYDKIEPSNWGAHLGHSSSPLINASTWALLLTGKVLEDDPNKPAAALRGLMRRVGEPLVRTAVAQAMKLLGASSCSGRRSRRACATRANWKQKVTPIPTTCSAKPRAPRTTRCAITRPMRRRLTRSQAGQGRCALEPGHLGQAVGAASAL